MFVLGQGETFTFVQLPPPEDGDILRLTHTLARRVTALLERRFGTLEAGADNVLEGAIGEGMQPVRTLPTDADSAEDDAPDEHPAARTRRRAASVDGFSIHAATAVPAHNRVGLEKLCRYGMRPAFSHERLSLSASGHVLCGLRRPWPTAGGVSVLSFEPVAFLRRLAPLIPPPWAHLVRHYGLFAPNAKGRDLLPAAPVSPDSIRIDVQLRADRSRLPPRTQDAGPASSDAPPNLPTAAPHPALRPLAAVAPIVPIAPETASAPSAATSATRNRRRVLPWSQLLRRVFLCDVLVCARCGGSMTVIAYLTDVVVVEKILAHLGLPTSPPSLSPARLPAQVEMFEDVTTDRGCSDRPRHRRSRAPPWAQNDADASPATDPATDSGDWGA